MTTNSKSCRLNPKKHWRARRIRPTYKFDDPASGVLKHGGWVQGTRNDGAILVKRIIGSAPAQSLREWRKEQDARNALRAQKRQEQREERSFLKYAR